MQNQETVKRETESKTLNIRPSNVALLISEGEEGRYTRNASKGTFEEISST